MANLVTSAQVKSVVTAVVAFDPSFFDTSIQFIEDSVICGILTKALYDDLLAKLALLPTTPLTPAYQELYDKVVVAESYAVAIESYEKDVQDEINNQGVMVNSTQYSQSATISSSKQTLGKIRSREVFYCEDLCSFLFLNAATYPLFDIEVANYKPELRGNFPL